MKVNNINQTENTDSITKSIESVALVSMTIDSDSTSISTIMGNGTGTGISIP